MEDRGTADEGVAGPTFSSTIVFQAPQAGHLPAHLGESAPQEVQNHIVFIAFFAISYRFKFRMRNSDYLLLNWERVIAVAMPTLRLSTCTESAG